MGLVQSGTLIDSEGPNIGDDMPILGYRLI